MKRDIDRSKALMRRAFILGAGKAALFGILAGRLVWLQVVESDKFRTLSDKNRISLRLVPAARGEIMDRFGVPVAVNEQNFRAFLVPEQSPDVDDSLKRLSTLIPVTEGDLADVHQGIKEHKPFAPVLVKENLTWEDMARVEMNLPDLPGVAIDEGQSRSYPLGAATAHIIGYVGRVSKAELTDDPIMSTPGFKIGKSGVEKTFDQILRGEAGQMRAEVNVVGREIRELSHDNAKPGDRLTLTLDADLQMQCQEMLKREKSAAAVVMDVHTGEIYALCSHPSFDPNVFSRGIPADLWEELLADDAKPLTNKVIAGQYPPGSTFKMVTALAGLKAGIAPGARTYCPGYYMLGSDKFHCWKKEGHGSIDMVGALRESCDTYFYDLGRRIGVDAIAKMARQMGMGDKLDIGLPAEGPGLIPDRAWKMKRYKQSWQQGETLNSAIGQGHTLATPLQLVTMVSRMVNGGQAVKPILVRTIESAGSQIHAWPDIGIPPQHLDIIRRGMEQVVNNQKGTAYGSRLQMTPFSMGGKTGTAQVRRITLKQRAEGIQNESLPWKFRHHALFVGYGPIDDPKYATAVIVEHGVGGSKTAAPIARDIMTVVQQRDPRKIRTVDDATAAAQNPSPEEEAKP